MKQDRIWAFLQGIVLALVVKVIDPVIGTINNDIIPGSHSN
jgi:hypothetical protein